MCIPLCIHEVAFMPRNTKNYAILLFIFPILIIVGEFLFYYLDDFLD